MSISWGRLYLQVFCGIQSLLLTGKLTMLPASVDNFQFISHTVLTAAMDSADVSDNKGGSSCDSYF